MVREPLRWTLDPGQPAPGADVLAALHRAARGPACDDWSPPAWLLPHQFDAARRLAGALLTFRGALLADATGLGKTYVALSVATRYRAPVVIAPAALVSQWRRVAARLGIAIRIATLESASRNPHIPRGDLVIVDEAHHLRNPGTRRYDAVARRVCRSHTLLLTATPVANGPRDLVALLRLFLPDNALAVLGVSSLEESLRRRQYADLARATSVLCVARSPDTLPGAPLVLPRATDAIVRDAASLPDATLRAVLDVVDRLEFPGVAGNAAATDLLRLHLVHRLASSAAALRETVDRHLAFLRRAIDAARAGQVLPRAAARALLGREDAAQLSFDLLPAVPIGAQALNDERERLEALRDLLPVSVFHDGRKVAALVRLLDERAGAKTIVFTAARATALSLAHVLGWRRVAVASGKGGVIASGPVPLDTTLSWFAPRARGAALPAPAAAVDTLIATDLVSEGLDLQDADAIIHFDLPWTPLRLAQRLGRIARLGGTHSTIAVWWFLPPPMLDRRLRLSARIAAKALAQRRLGTDAAKQAGSVALRYGALHWKDSLAALGAAAVADVGPERIWHAVTEPQAAAFALRWTVNEIAPDIPELVVLAGRPAGPVASLQRINEHIAALSTAAPRPAAEPVTWPAHLRQLARRRLSAAGAPVNSDSARALSRTILIIARRAARRRDVGLVSRLDATLDRVRRGLPVGSERALAAILREGADPQALDRWLATPPHQPPTVPAVRLTAALIGAE